MTRIKENESQIDVLFYGSVNERRRKILHELHYKCKLYCAFGVYGKELNELISQAKIVLNMHYYATAIHEITRTSYLMANKKFIISEYGDDAELERPYYGAIQFCKYENLVSNVLGFLQDSRGLREYSANAAHMRFKDHNQREMVQAALAA